MPVSHAALDRVFNPKTVVVFGDKKAGGYMWLNSQKQLKGKVYSVQIDPNEIPGIEALGVQNFKSLAEVPGPVDYGIIAVPRSVAPRILADCITHKVGGVTMFTAGFAETHTADGMEMQNKVLAMAKQSGMVLIGPNCMGIYNPGAGLCFSPGQPVYDGGNIAFCSQSGSHGVSFSLGAPELGLKISKMVSFGNGIVLENADFLEYMANDAQSQVIVMYVEGLKDGRRFFKLLRETAPKKPVIIWKGGQTDEGKRATSSHTASLSESLALWEAACKQTGAILVRTLEEALDTAKALVQLPAFTGSGCGLMGGAGGQSVSITDAFAHAGMRVPALSQSSYKRLGEFFSLVGASFSNPIDLGTNRKELDTILDILTDDPVIDVIVMQVPVFSFRAANSMVTSQVEAMTKLKERSGKKPLVAVALSPRPFSDAEALKEIASKFEAGGVPSFTSYDRAARALKNAVDYHRFRTELG